MLEAAILDIKFLASSAFSGVTTLAGSILGLFGSFSALGALFCLFLPLLFLPLLLLYSLRHVAQGLGACCDASGRAQGRRRAQDGMPPAQHFVGPHLK